MVPDLTPVTITPAISVILPAYNAEKYIRKSIESVLAQTLKNFECIIIDNASTDSTAEIISSYNDSRIKVIRNPENLGLIASLNIGVRAARGTYLARMDHDDIALPDRFQREFDYLEDHPDVAIVGTWSELIDSEGRSIGIHRNAVQSNVIKYELLFGNSVTHPSIMMRRKDILELGGYDPQWINTEDYNLYSRAIRNYKIENIPELLLKYRVHGSSLTGSADSQAIIHENTKKMIRQNISFYTEITEGEQNLITQVLTARNPNPQQKISDVLRAYKLHKRIYRAFLIKETGSLDMEDRKEVHQRYIGRRNLMFKKYLVGKYHLLKGKKA